MMSYQGKKKSAYVSDRSPAALEASRAIKSPLAFVGRPKPPKRSWFDCIARIFRRRDR